MKPQLSQDYNVDNRYRGLERAADNEAGRKFVEGYISARRQRAEPNMKSELAQEDVFNFDGNIRFRNLFRPSK
jgi:hypothetical protein